MNGTQVEDLVYISLFFPGILVLSALPSVIFKVRIEEGKVIHLFLSKFIVSSYPISEFLTAKQGGVVALILYFKTGKISVFAIPIEEAKRLVSDLFTLSGKVWSEN
ncbi:hypothetical protein EHO59_13945 [Leptospira semungkisensis]|uniref:PH domain-containing protein n=2 Tax=Leptospira semungkisensis TaxID=2484985 RepID=A0A4R9FQE7_9LEPT|nr:hypothetical protein EHO59_13945 [Leptospira semungkisensis]